MVYSILPTPKPVPIFRLRLAILWELGPLVKLNMAGEHILTGTKVAIKILNRRTIKNLDMVSKIKREITILKLFHHPHIIKLQRISSSTTTFTSGLQTLDCQISWLMGSSCVPVVALQTTLHQRLSQASCMLDLRWMSGHVVSCGIIRKIKSGVFQIPDYLNQSVVRLLLYMLMVDPMKRATIEDIKKHEWFQKDLPAYLFPPPYDHNNSVIDQEAIAESVRNFKLNHPRCRVQFCLRINTINSRLLII
ncbi:hypothetical protein Pmani_024652 [Petrolisthes manimaculis]|uniref:Protein kinase domain-containing protein n=1 Tax=Petrolisthes manimaculis TaxID=1843537 RepID=A0AAE1P761_9EUCA|nr:hypothetical protein Pmani_024652 [Petrolisthes manimaculis]